MGQVLIVTGIGETVDLRLPTQSSKADDAMIQRRTATEQEVPVVWVSVGQASIVVGEEVHTAWAHPPAPGLGIVDRRRAGRQRQHCANRLLVREMCAHVNHILLL